MSQKRKARSLRIPGFLLISLLAVMAAEAGTVRGHSTHGQSHGSSHHGSSHYGWYGGPSYNYSYGYAYAYTPYYAGYGYYAGYPGAYYGPAYALEAAYIDTDIRPAETAVFLDGEPVGTVDDFDGFPRYLTVVPGRHQLTFKAEGHSSVTRSIRVPRGALLQLDFTLPRAGDSDKEAAMKMEAEIVIPESSPDETAQDHVELQPSESVPDKQDEQTAQDPGFMRIQIKPGDASVYLDGELLGSASRLAGLHGEMRIEAGVHKIEAVRPGFHPSSKRILIGEGEHLAVELELQKEAVSPGPPK